MDDSQPSASPVELATELTIAWLSNPNTRAASGDVPAFLSTMYEAVQSLGKAGASNTDEATSGFTPAVTARRSLASRDSIISMIDGKPYKTLRRHLSTHGLTPEQYRERYKLKVDYPMVAPSYSEARRSMAKKIGLGQKGRVSRSSPKVGESPAKPVTRRARKPKATPSE